jgi:hypothetical protein
MLVKKKVETKEIAMSNPQLESSSVEICTMYINGLMKTR